MWLLTPFHSSEGQLNCLNATVQYNDIGPCGTDYFQNVRLSVHLLLSCWNGMLIGNSGQTGYLFRAPLVLCRTMRLQMRQTEV